MSVVLFNVFEDEILAPQVTLDKAYDSVRVVNGNGTLKADTVTLSDIPPFGFVAFEVK